MLISSPIYAVTHYPSEDNIALMGARLSTNGNHTRIVFEFNKAFRYHTFTLTKPDRFIIDLSHVRLETNLNELPLRQQSLIKDIRHALNDPTKLRIVFDLYKHVKFNTFILKPNAGYGYRLVVDLMGQHIISHKKIVPASHALPKKKHVIHGRNIIVVIDPGHGGKDPGATGPRGIHEKNVVLAISKDLASDLNAIPGITTKMTRYGDYFITLRDRLRVARRDHADFFVAIHADAYENADARGASVFALSQRGATSEAARWLAQKENYSELGGVDLSDKSRVLRSVLIDLSQTATITQSLHIGRSIVHTLSKVTPMHSRSVEQARFVVLKSPDIPSLLIETGFISNYGEERRLNTPWYQHQLAAAITAGIKSYFLRYPPPDTLFAVNQNARIYVVHPGDSLASLAQRYDTTTHLLMRMNHLRFARVYPGEHLRIPSINDEN